MIRNFLHFALIPLLATFLAAGPWGTPIAQAQPSDMSQAIRIEVLPGWRRADGVHVAGLRVRLAPGWKTYWRSAGAAGISPQMDWRGSGNVRSVTPAWPVPHVFGRTGALSIGYDRDFILPLLIAPGGGGPIRLRGTLDIGVCADICLPARLFVDAMLEPSVRAVPEIEAALADRPRRIRATARCSLQPTADGLSLTGQIDVPRQGSAETVVFEVPDPKVWVTDAAVARQGGRITARADILASNGGGVSFDRSQVLMTVIGDRSAVEILGCTG